MNIKIAGLSDIENLYELNELFENETSKEEMKKFMNQNNHEIICIAYSGSVAVGYCTGLIVKSICYKNSRIDIEALFVKEEYRNKGFGKALITYMEKEASSKNITHFHINTNNGNTVAKSFYKKIGYKETGEILLDKTLSH